MNKNTENTSTNLLEVVSEHVRQMVNDLRREYLDAHLLRQGGGVAVDFDVERQDTRVPETHKKT